VKIIKNNKGASYTFGIISSFVGIVSFNMTEDWSSAFFQGLVAGFYSYLIYIIGYSNGVDEGISKGYDKALEDLKPVLPSEIQNNLNEKTNSNQQENML